MDGRIGTFLTENNRKPKNRFHCILLSTYPTLYHYFNWKFANVACLLKACRLTLKQPSYLLEFVNGIKYGCKS